jgi:DMSO/TMAO reductase YedYZ molybdopterin-dependent catalytic subunit
VTDRRIGRAAFLGVVGAGVAGVVLGGRLDRAASRPLGSLDSVIPEGVRSFFPTGWRIYAISPPWPTFDPQSYRLTITGQVERPLSLAWPQFLDLEQARQVTDFHCVTGWSVDNVHWQGVRFDTLWNMVRPLPTARYVRFVSLEDPYTDTLTFDQTTLPNVMLAHGMDGAPLSRAHGSPIRLVIPEMYGYKGVKWLHRIELMDHLEPGYWEQNGYDVDAWVGHSNGY